MTVWLAARGLGRRVRATVLVADVPFSARYDLDRTAGTISRVGHPLVGESITGRILVLRSVQGGIAGAWAFLAMAGLGVGPAGLVFDEVNPVVVQGAVLAGLPLLAGIDLSVFTRLHQGDVVELDPGIPGLVTVGATRLLDPHLGEQDPQHGVALDVAKAFRDEAELDRIDAAHGG